ncbi:hypothetical protein [Agrobacterium tumefaciens]|uniref:hypothetical protein n=1 Tax=Agrobacterium tumefaciens TaxID=358 RepID=UPI000556C2C1|nr:hypothetical protein [Agrobacterium tumefaciens]
MRDEAIPQDPLAGSPELDGRLDGLESRISKIESDNADSALSAEDLYNRLLHHEVLQRILMRYAAIFVAMTVIGTMAWFALYVLSIYFVGPIVLVPATVAVALFVAPIVSISAVTIMLLLGAFRRFKDDDIEQVNAQAIIEAAKAATGN